MFGWQRNQFGPGNANAHDSAVPLKELAEVQAEKGVQVGVRIAGQILAGQAGHLLVIFLLAVRVNGISAVVPPQVAVKGRTNVKEFVKDRDKLLIERQLEKARQTKSHEVEDFAAVDEIALNLKGDATATAAEPAVAEAQRRDAGLQPMPPAVARGSQCKLQPRDIHVIKRRAARDHVRAKPMHVATKI